MSNLRAIGWERWREDRASWIAIAVGSLIAGIGWGWTTRPMGDSAAYRNDATVIFEGWARLTNRTAGYPFLLWATGSTGSETHALFITQLALHITTVVLVVLTLRRLNVASHLRFAAALLLMMPPPLLSVVYAQSEALAAALLTAAAWSFVRWLDRPATWTLVQHGTLLGLAVWVKPAYAALVIPAAAITAFVARTQRPTHAVAAVAGPTMVLIGALLTLNLVRFDYVGPTPLAGWHLGSRTSGYVERLDEDWEPARSILVAERDRQLLLGDSVDAPNYSFAVRDELSAATGLRGTDLDRYMLDLNLHLILRHPVEYQGAVLASIPRYVAINAQTAINGLGRPATWTLTLVHWVLVGGIGAALVAMPGLMIAKRVRRDWATAWAYTIAVAGGVFAIAVLTETGAARLRTPTDPLILIAAMVSVSAVRSVRAARHDRS